MTDLITVGRRRPVFSTTYRAAEMAQLADWIRRGVSGSVVGTGGAGKSNLLGFLCARPDALQRYFEPDGPPVLAVLVDLNDLPADDLATFHRVILRAFHEARGRVEPALQQRIQELYDEVRAAKDPFLTQSALREWLFALTGQGTQVVLVLDRFDRFCEDPPPRMMDTLRALRDAFKGQLVYLMGMRQPVRYLSDPAVLGELYEVLDSHICWVGPMADEDALRVVAEELDPATAEGAGAEIVALSGGYPALLKAVCHAWPAPPKYWPSSEVAREALANDAAVRVRLDEIWNGLTQAEQSALADVRRLSSRAAAALQSGADAQAVQAVAQRNRERLAAQHERVLAELSERRLCRHEPGGWVIHGELLAEHIAGVAVAGRGTIWRDAVTGELHQGSTVLGNLANLEERLLAHLVDHPRVRHSKSNVIEQVWPDESVADGVMDDALYQVVKELRRKIEPDPAAPRYLVTWRGKPEGGYQLFPEGRPAG
jgi:DNA-binding response OmpR family regulator